MKFWRPYLIAPTVVLIAICTTSFARAQQSSDWLPQGIESLRQSASSKTEFTLDHSMLEFVSKFDPDNDDLRRVVAGVNGISVRRYHFPGYWSYDAGALRSVSDDYHAAGWRRLVNNHDRHGGPGETDLWVRLENKAVSNFAILVVRSNDVALIQVSGSISPLDLLHLSGHFGIPKIDGGVLVPSSEHRQ